MYKFKLIAPYKPCGDQPQAIDDLVSGLEDGIRTQVLLGVTGSGKSYTIANVIEQVQRPALVIAHNKILAAQLCNELRSFFPHNRVEYFVSYYDYFQPEAYIPRSDTYIEKELQINDEIDKLRHSATSSLCERRDTIVVASVSCIYGLGAPKEYYSKAISIRENMEFDRDELIDMLVGIMYKRADIDFVRATFRVRGDIIEVFPVQNSEIAIRLEFFGDTIEKISEIDPLTGRAINQLKHINFFPASHYIVGGDIDEVLNDIRLEMLTQEKLFQDNNKFIEAQRIAERVSYDVEMIKEVGYCSGIENYSRYFDGRTKGMPPYTLLDFFPNDFVTIVDESHMTLPQIRAMYRGDQARKGNLIDYGFRLPSAYDNRPLNFEEFDDKVGQIICMSATPADYELEQAGIIAEQIIRPTGLLDPEIYIKPITGQIDDLISEIEWAKSIGGRVLITTLTKKMAESLTNYLKEHKLKVRYMHSDIVALERIEIIKYLRQGEFDILVGINLLREGLDIPEVVLVAILDADKEGFLRSDKSLIQTIGRAARNSQSKVIMYADNITGSMQRAIDETNRRREKQKDYNRLNNITPKTIIRPMVNTLEITKKISTADTKKMNTSDIIRQIEQLKGFMKSASQSLDFESAIRLRDEISRLKGLIRE